MDDGSEVRELGEEREFHAPIRWIVASCVLTSIVQSTQPQTRVLRHDDRGDHLASHAVLDENLGHRTDESITNAVAGALDVHRVLAIAEILRM